MENRSASAKGDVRYLGWYVRNFFMFKDKGFVFVAFLVCYLPFRVVFGSSGRRVVKKTFERITKRKDRAIPFPLQGKTYFMVLRDFSDFDIFHEICIRDFYQTGTFLAPGMTVIDVGANIGTFSVVASATVGAQGRVIAFEPEATNIATMQKSIAANNITNITLSPSAVSDFTGPSKIFISTSHEGHSLIRKDDSLGETEIMATTIDHALETLGIKTIDILKVDVEGSEIAALKGASQTIARGQVSRIMVDVVHYEGEEQEVAQYLNSLGFQTSRVEDYVLAVK